MERTGSESLLEDFASVPDVADSARSLALPAPVPEPKGSKCRRFFARKRNWAFLSVVLLACGIGSYFAISTVAKAIIQSRVHSAPITVDAVYLEVKPAIDGPMRPRVLVSAPAWVLTIPLLSFSATVNTNSAQVSIEKDGSFQVGTFLPDPISITSGQAVNLEVSGPLHLNLEQANKFQVFMTDPNATVSVDAEFSVAATVYGFFPYTLTGVSISRAVTVKALDMRGSNKELNMSSITAMEGLGAVVQVGAQASFYNPSVAHLQMQGPLRVDVLYETKSGCWAPIGMVIIGYESNITITPGLNNIGATFYLTPTIGNDGAIRSAITDFLGVPHAFGKSGLTPLSLRVVAPPDSPLGGGLMPPAPYDPMLTAVIRGLDLPITFRPVSMLFLTAVALDVHLINFSERAYELTVGVHIPVPRTVYLEAINASVYYPDINGELVYSFFHALPAPIELPGLQNTSCKVSLHLTEIDLPSFHAIEQIAKEVLEYGKSHAGVLVRLRIRVDDFVIETDYRNERIDAFVRIHAI